MLRERPAVAVKRVALFALVWLALAGVEAEALILGIGAVPAAAWVSLALMPPRGRVALPALLALMPGFLWRSLLGGIDVARRAFDPAMPLRPGWIVLPSSLPPGAPRAVVGGEFSLLPGTLVAGTRDGRLLIHALDTGQDVAGAIAAAERDLARVIGDAAPRAGTSGGAR